MRITIGVVVSLLATTIVVFTAAYLFQTFWLGKVVDYDIMIQGRKIRPEMYPFLFLALFSAGERLHVHARPDYAFFTWLDRVVSWAFAGFILATILKVGISNPNPDFLPILAGFFVAAIVDVIMNGRHRFGGKENGLSGGVVGTHEVVAAGIAEFLKGNNAVLLTPAGDDVRLTWIKPNGD